MTKSDFEQKQYEISVCAGMNQRYHQSRAKFWSCMDRGFKIAVGVLAVAGACLSVLTVGVSDWGLTLASAIVAGIAAFAAIALNVLPFGEWASRHSALFQRWTDLREDVDAMLFDVGDSLTADNIARLKELDAKIHRISSTEPEAATPKLRQFCREEVRSRHTPNAVTVAT